MNTAVSKLCIALLGLAMASAVPAAGAELFWEPDDDESITHHFGEGPPMVVCMQGRKIVMQVQADGEQGLRYMTRFFEVPAGRVDKGKAIFEADSTRIPDILVGGAAFALPKPESVIFDGRLTFIYPEQQGVKVTRTIYPSMTRALMLDEWHLSNRRDGPLEIGAEPGRHEELEGEKVVMVWRSSGLKPTKVQAGGSVAIPTSVHARLVDEDDMSFDLDAERAGRLAVAEAAWKGPGRLETPDRLLDLAFALQKFHVLECPIESVAGVITHNGSLRYSPGVWANDPVEYSSPLFPFFGDEDLNEASMNMYRIWLKHCREHGIDPYPGSFEHAALKLVQKYRGDDAMVLYGLSKFLLFQGDREAAEEMWPLIEFSAESVKRNTRDDGIVASQTDEMEGRYPTGDANLSTSSLAYGGYRLAARVAASLGKPEAAEFDRRAAALAPAIEKFFGATVEDYETYRYYDGNTTLRGWILLPLAMDITERQEATVDAMLSKKLWPNRLQGGDILAESTRETEWGRETYYALRVFFKAGRTAEALDTTQRVVRAQIFGPKGPYPDEDATDMLCPGSLYPRAFIEGMFGIVPTGLDSFECTPWLPDGWPEMALRDLRAFGTSWDLVVRREGEQQRVIVTSEGRQVYSSIGPAGERHSVSFSR